MSGRILRTLFRSAALSGALALAGSADAAGVADPLAGFLSGLHTLQTSFTQEVRDAHDALVDAGHGQLLIERPGRFRWEYVPREKGAGESQLLLADGRNLWFLDRELSQATVKPQAQALGDTPMLLLAGNESDWRESFRIEPMTARDGLRWQAVVPRAASADFTRAELGFRHTQLVAMVVLNQLGQRVTLRFSGARRNVNLSPEQFRFVPGAGVDVVGTALP